MSIKKNQIANQVVSNTAIPLPVPADPNKWICVQMMIPDSLGHRAAFLGAISNLGTWRVWQRDTDHNGTIVAQLWQKARRTVQFLMCTNEPPELVIEWESDMDICEALRYHNGKLQGFCCGTWQDIGSDDNSAPSGGAGQPGGGQPQPQPGGGQQCYDLAWDASGVGNIPTIVSAGDVLTLQSASGAGNTPGDARWYCIDGLTFFAGGCTGIGQLNGGDPLAATFRGKLIYNINGTYYPATIGTPFTVPGGISNQPVTIQANFPLSGANGSYKANVCATNNATTSFTHVFNFVTSSGGWTPDTNCPGDIEAIYVPGSGWEGSMPACQPTTMYLYMSRVATHAVTLQSVEFGYTIGAGTGLAVEAEFYTNIGLYGTVPTAPGTYNYLMSAVVAGVNILSVRWVSGAAASTITLVSMTVHGLGVDPF